MGLQSCCRHLHDDRTHSDGTLVIVYMESCRATTVDMAKLSGPAKAQWFNPRTGTYTVIAGSPFANSGAKVFMPPELGDWVLVLETKR